MEIVVPAGSATAGPEIELREADDFSRLSVRLRGGATLAEAAGALGARADGEHIFVPADRIEALAAGRADDGDWRISFAGMVEYAATKGWTDSAGRIRIHVEHEEHS